MNRPNSTPPLNPFAFPAETDARFLLLLLAVIGSTLVIADGFIGGVILSGGYILSFLGAIGITVLVLLLARRWARQDAQTRIRQNHWTAFPPKDADPIKRASLSRMERYLYQLVERIPGVHAVAPTFVWDDASEGRDQTTGIAFGFGPQKYVCLRNGLHTAFVKVPKSNRFNAVLLHELGHIENRDVNKTVLSMNLGKSFFRAALIILVMFNVYMVWFFIKRLILGESLQPIVEALPYAVSYNIKTILFILLVEMIRSSVLRMREYYADARARIWMGQPDGFFELFKPKPPQASTSSQSSESSSGLKTAWHRLKKRFYGYLAPFHPTNKQRVDALITPDVLYHPSQELAFFSGLLSGLLLNSSFIILTGLNEFWSLNTSINAFAQQVLSSSGLSWVLLMIAFILQIGLILLYLAIIVALLVGFGGVPIAVTIGLQVQAAAFADERRSSSERYVTPWRLAVLALLLGAGFIVGCMLVPFPKPLSLVGSSPWAIALYALMWAFTFWIWLLPLKWSAAKLYTHHVGAQEPRRKRRFLTTLSIVALLPTVVASSMAHIGLSTRQFAPETVPVPHLSLWLLGIGFLMFLIQIAIWTVGWLIMGTRGWLRLPRCPHCTTSLPRHTTTLTQCPTCKKDLSEWAHFPAPLNLPPVPRPVAASAGPPPL